MLDRLIRYRKFLLDEKRRKVKQLQDREAGFEAAIARLDAEVLAEQQVARGSAEVAHAYGGYAQAALGRRGGLQASLAGIRTQLEAALAELAEAFEELKKYEIAKADRDRALQREEMRRETAFLDEVALNAHRRRGD